MSQKLILVIITLVILIGGGYYFYQSKPGSPYSAPAPQAAPPPAPAPSPAPTPPAVPPPAGSPGEPPSAGGREPQVHVISMIGNSFSPDTITIRKGDTVLFKNNDVKVYIPASDPHPIHNICPGFDARSTVQPGQAYSYVFTEAKTCPFHDHLNPGVKGKIIVTE